MKTNLIFLAGVLVASVLPARDFFAIPESYRSCPGDAKAATPALAVPPEAGRNALRNAGRKEGIGQQGLFLLSFLPAFLIPFRTLRAATSAIPEYM